MSDPTLGNLADETAERDAVHVAIAPVVAAEHLQPGQHVRLGADGRATVNGEHIGIVDPFLRNPVTPGQWFYLCLYPQTVTGMRHHWSHPAFADGSPVKRPECSASVAWLRGFAAEVDMRYEDLLEAARQYRRYGTEVCLPFDTPERCWSDGSVFWSHFHAVTGEDYDTDDGLFFRCAC